VIYPRDLVVVSGPSCIGLGGRIGGLALVQRDFADDFIGLGCLVFVGGFLVGAERLELHCGGRVRGVGGGRGGRGGGAGGGGGGGMWGGGGCCGGGCGWACLQGRVRVGG